MSIGNFSTPNLIGPVHTQPPQKIGIDFVPLCRLADVALLIDRHEAHQAHQTSDPFLVHEMILIAQVPRHLTHAIKWRLQELLVDQPHQIEVHLIFAFGHILK